MPKGTQSFFESSQISGPVECLGMTFLRSAIASLSPEGLSSATASPPRMAAGVDTFDADSWRFRPSLCRLGAW